MFRSPSRSLKSALAVLALSCLGGSMAAKADMLPASSITLLDHTQLVGGSHHHHRFSTVLDFLVPAAGTVSLDFSDLTESLPGLAGQGLSKLKLKVFDFGEMLGSLRLPGDGSGSLSFSVDGPGHYFAIVSGHLKGHDLGLYSLDVHWTGNLSPTATAPLPAAGWLLVSGAGGLLAFARKRRRGEEAGSKVS